jgi:hypothetical protein
MSGDGVNGGWLKVRGALRYRRISAGIKDRDPELHLGQDIDTPQRKLTCGKLDSTWESPKRATKNVQRIKLLGV